MFRQHMYDEGILETLLGRVGKDSQWIDCDGDHAIALDGDHWSA